MAAELENRNVWSIVLFGSSTGPLLVHTYSFCLSFSNFVSGLALRTDKVIIVGNFNIHIDVENESFGNGFITGRPCSSLRSCFFRSFFDNLQMYD